MIKTKKFCSVWGRLFKGEFNFYTDEIGLYLTNELPIPEIHSKKSDLKGIKEEHGYQETILATMFIDGGCYKKLMVKNDIFFIATNGNFGPFRYAILYNNSHKDKALLGYLDYGEHIEIKTRNSGKRDTFTIIFCDSCLFEFR